MSELLIKPRGFSPRNSTSLRNGCRGCTLVVMLKETVNSPAIHVRKTEEAFEPDPHGANLVANGTGLIALEKKWRRDKYDRGRTTHSALLSDLQPSQHRGRDGMLPCESGSRGGRWQAHRGSRRGASLLRDVIRRVSRRSLPVTHVHRERRARGRGVAVFGDPATRREGGRDDRG